MKIKVIKAKEIEDSLVKEIAETDIISGYALVFPKDKRNLDAAKELFALVEGGLAILNIIDETDSHGVPTSYYGVLIGFDFKEDTYDNNKLRYYDL